MNAVAGYTPVRWHSRTRGEPRAASQAAAAATSWQALLESGYFSDHEADVETRSKSRSSTASLSPGKPARASVTPKSRGPPADAGSSSPKRKRPKRSYESTSESSARGSGGAASQDDESEAGGEEARGGDDVQDRDDVARSTPVLQPVSNLEVSASIPIKIQHDSWSAFKSYLDKYMPATWQNITVQYVSNVRKRNNELKKSADGKKGLAVFVPEALETFKPTYICTHGWPVKSRGSGTRPRQKLRHTGCSYGFTASLFLDEGDMSWKVGVHSIHAAHNHTLSEEIYKSYCERRVVPVTDPIVDDVRLMIKAGGRPGRIYEYLRQNSGRHVVIKDVHNLISKLRQTNEDLSDDALVALQTSCWV